ncbi:MAG: redoxin family protein [Pyrinomonadaceae bacterium MAG19_C2-C3]|nr:redoxin family protein [Pyrinomonadaceae bacterium MAG19_C2-C3]
MDGSTITIPIAFLAGLASFLSPCVLPLVPGYISLISGVSIDNLKNSDASRTNARRAVVINSLAFNAGLSLIFISLGALAGLVGASITSNPWVRIIGGTVIILFGLQLIGLLKIGALYRDTRKFSDDKPRGAGGAFVLGLAFAAGWTPCIGPILGGILGLAATSGGWKSGLLLSSFYAAGLSVPFLLTGLGINKFLNFYQHFRQHLHKVEVVSGVMLILIGVLVATGQVTRLASFATWLPNAENLVERVATTSQPASATNTAAVNPASFPLPPEAELKTLDGQTFNLQELRGQVVLLNFWASYCVPCRTEIPELNEMQRELGGRGFQVVGVNYYDDADGVREFQKDVPQDYKQLLAGDDAIQKFDANALPTTYIIDRNGRVRDKILGSRDRAGFERAVLPLLDEATPTAGNQ